MEWKEDKQGDIELHPELVKQRQDTYSSLTDISGIAIFSDEFQVKVEQWQKSKYDADAVVYQKVFFGQQINAIDDDSFMQKLFTEQGVEMYLHDYTDTGKKVSFIDIGLVIFSALLMAAVYLFIFGKKIPKRRSNK